jgi:oligopeptide transport system substrate-binding protein
MLPLFRLAFALVLTVSALAQAQAPKTLRVAFPIAENGLDPQAIYDEYSAKVCNAIFDTLYTYDYFARPAKLVPNTADGLPRITDGGRTFTVKVRPGRLRCGARSSWRRIARNASGSSATARPSPPRR